MLVQGRGIEEFVQFELEPKILGEAKLGYEEVHSPEMFEPHLGVDESGKGDFFGPLVISGVYVDRGIARKLLDAGVVDSKRISSDARIRALADTIRKTSQGLVETVLIGPAKYNELYEKFDNLNRLLGWGHARVIENLVTRKPGCLRSLSDQFADARVIKESLMRHGRNIVIEQRPRAESDIAVAAASIMAREGFINWLERKGKELGMRLERGVSAGVKETAKKLVEMSGRRHCVKWRRFISAPRMRLLRSITPRRRLAKIGDGAPPQTLTTKALKYRLQKIAFLCLIGHRESHKERFIKYIWRN